MGQDRTSLFRPKQGVGSTSQQILAGGRLLARGKVCEASTVEFEVASIEVLGHRLSHQQVSNLAGSRPVLSSV